jgi:hypothetical protein
MANDTRRRADAVELAVVLDRDTPPGNCLPPLIRLLCQIAERERRAPVERRRQTKSSVVNQHRPVGE